MGRWNGKTKERGYGADHQAIRRQRAAIHRPGNPCAIGGEPLWDAPELLDLAHDHVNGGYLPGLSCRAHNRAEGAIRGNQVRGYVHAASTIKGTYVRCQACGQSYSRAARSCEICGAHYHPSYAEQRTCGRACGVELRRRNHGIGGGHPPKPRPPCQRCGQPCSTLTATICRSCQADIRQAVIDARPGPSSKVMYYTCRYCGKQGTAPVTGQVREVCAARACQLARLAANNLRVRKGMTKDEANAAVTRMVARGTGRSWGWAQARDW